MSVREFYDHELRLPAGRWVREGMTERFIADDRERMKRDDYDEAETLMDVIAANLAANPATTPMPLDLCACGCLLAHAAETCPACLVWAIDDAIRQSWRDNEQRYETTHEYERKAA